MGAAGSVLLIHGESDATAMPTHGVRLSQLQAFVDACGGLEYLQGLTVFDVRDRFIIPMTLSTKSSFCDWLRSQQHPAVGVPSVFISHVWQYCFLDIVYALQHHFRNTPDIIIWFDLFTINQHFPIEITTSWLEQLKAFIEGIGHVVLVYFPMTSMSSYNANKTLTNFLTNPFHRLWCIYELYAVAAHETKFEIAMKADDIKHFSQLICAGDLDVIDGFISNVDINTSHTTDPKHKQALKDALVEVDASFPIEQAIVRQSKKWLLHFCQQLLLDKPGKDDLITANIQHILGLLHVQLTDTSQAKTLFMECYETRKKLLGESHPDNIVVMNNLASILFQEEHYHEAEKLFYVCLQLRTQKLGKEHPDTIAAMNNLAMTLMHLQRYAEAQPLLIVAMEILKHKLGEQHPEYIQAMINVGYLYNEEKKYDRALLILEQVLMKFNSNVLLEGAGLDNSTSTNNHTAAEVGKVAGESTPSIPKTSLSRNSDEYLNVLKQITTTYVKLGQYDDVEPLLATCISLLQRKHGDHHLDTIEKKLELATVYKQQLRYDKAEMLFLACLQELQSHYEADHPTTVKTMTSLAIMFYQLGNAEKAGLYFFSCYQISKVKLGEEHSDTMKLKKILVKIQKAVIAAHQKG